jgi:hypothetical protein
MTICETVATAEETEPVVQSKRAAALGEALATTTARFLSHLDNFLAKSAASV